MKLEDMFKGLTIRTRKLFDDRPLYEIESEATRYGLEIRELVSGAVQFEYQLEGPGEKVIRYYSDQILGDQFSVMEEVKQILEINSL